MIFCTACGRPRSGPVRYCTSCGAAFPDGASNESVAESAASQFARVPDQAAAGDRPDTVSVYRPAGRAVVPAQTGRVAVPAHRRTVASRPLSGSVADDPFGRLEPRGGGRAGLAERFGRTAADRRTAGAEPEYLPPDFPADLPPAPLRGARRRAAVAALAAVVVLVAAAGGVDVWLMHRHHGASRALPALTRPGSTAPRGTNASGRPRRTASASGPAPSPAVSAGIVTVAPGISDSPDTARVEAFLGSYFTAINNHSYQQFRPLLGQAMRQDEPVAKFDSGYESTTDSGAVLTAISDISPGLVGAAVSFSSDQLPANSPSHSGCTDWSITLYLSQHGSRYVLEPPPPGYRAVYQPC